MWIAAVTYSVRRHLAERDVGGLVADKAGSDAGESGADRAARTHAETA